MFPSLFLFISFGGDIPRASRNAFSHTKAM
jgi:hypothetical protein